MERYKYLIIGGGMAADSAVRGIRDVDGHGRIGIICAEAFAPYDRPPLSKGLWQGKELESIWRKTAEVPGVELHLRTTAARLDVRQRRVTDQAGRAYSYEKLLLATGCAPRRLPFAGNGVIYFRSLADYRHLRELTECGDRFVVIGGSFIGSEVAAALAMNGKQVTMIFREAEIGGRLLSHSLGHFLSALYRSKGVEVLSGVDVLNVTPQKEGFIVRISEGHEIAADGVVAGLGVLPRVRLAKTSGLRVDDGITVDQFLRTTHPDIYAAGDVAYFYSAALHKRMRVEHDDNANSMGRAAGRAMAGAIESYRHLPMFYSELFDLGYEAVGEIDNRLKTVADWADPYRKGVVYYLRDDKIGGILLWNVSERVGDARTLIEDGRVFACADLKGLIAV